MTCVIAVEVEPGAVPRGLYYDTQDSYHYVCARAPAGRLVVGGEDHKSGQADDATERHAGSRPGRDGSFRR